MRTFHSQIYICTCIHKPSPLSFFFFLLQWKGCFSFLLKLIPPFLVWPQPLPAFRDVIDLRQNDVKGPAQNNFILLLYILFMPKPNWTYSYFPNSFHILPSLNLTPLPVKFFLCSFHNACVCVFKYTHIYI